MMRKQVQPKNDGKPAKFTGFLVFSSFILYNI